jgi:hypothetical protein
MGPQSRGSPNFGNFGTPTWESHDKMTFWVLVSWPSIEYIIRGTVVASPKSEPWWVLWICVCPWLVLAPKCSNYALTKLVVWFVHVRVNSWCLSFFLVPILELQHALLPPKCCEPGSVPQLLTISMFSPQTHIWVYQGAWERVTSFTQSTSFRRRYHSSPYNIFYAYPRGLHPNVIFPWDSQN